MKIAMKTPLVEIDGDEMTRVLWAAVKETLLAPFVDLKTEYYDLSVTERDKTEDRVTHEAAAAVLRYGVGVKCATITTTEARLKEYGLRSLYPSPNATIRTALDGTVFRSPVLLEPVKSAIATWTEPVVIARHAYGDVYEAAEMAVSGPGKAELVWTGADGSERRVPVANIPGSGVLQAMYNLDTSIESFARSCFRYALDAKLPLMFAAKDTISKTYDGRFREIFDRVYKEYAERFAAAGITYFYTLIDDAVARVVKGRGGILWACKNYDGDVMSDMVASASGSLAMMRSVLVSPSGAYEFEAAHGTVQRHYYRYLSGEKPSTNPSALIFAWTGALSKRAELDGITKLAVFARNLEAALIATIESGYMTADLQHISSRKSDKALDSWAFLEKVAERMNLKERHLV